MSQYIVKGRFAPSPSGRMHLGNIFAALMSWFSAKSKGGVWLLRIEDLDSQRCRMEYALQLEDDLRWIGLDWDEGGTENRGSNVCVGSYIQSQRSDVYQHCLTVLSEKGLTYPCYCTRSEIMATQAPHESDGRIVYKGTCRPKYISADGIRADAFHCPKFSPDDNSTTRIFVPDREITFTDGHFGKQTVNLARHCGDFVLRRRDGAWAYQLAVVVDDALMGVTEVVRGRDLLLSAAQQVYIFEMLDFQPPEFIHHPLICNDRLQRLCKRDKSMDMGCIRKRMRPEQVIGELAFHAGIIDTPAEISLIEALQEFSWNKVIKNDIILHEI